MESLNKKTSSQLFFAQTCIERLEKLHAEGASQVNVLHEHNHALLSLREAWWCWLSELCHSLFPSAESQSIRSFAQLTALDDDMPSALQALKTESKSPSSWVAAYILIESDVSCISSSRSESATGQSIHQDASGLIGVVQLVDEPLQPQSKLEDLKVMHRSLKQHINSTREQLVEW